MPSKSITELLTPAIVEFTTKVAQIVETATLDRLRAALEGEFGKGRAAGGASHAPRGSDARDTAVARGKRRSPARTAKATKARKLQGQYLGLLRGLKDKDRAQVKAVAAKEGVAAAVEAGRKLIGAR